MPGSSLFRQGTEVPAIQRGNLEMSTMTTFEVAQQIAEWGFFNRAFLFRDWDHATKVMNGPIGERYRKEVADKMGIVILAPTYLGTRQLNLRAKREVKGPADLKGVKLRMPGGPEWLLLGESLGVTPTPMAMPEVYLALKTGSIDGQENPLTIMNAAKYYEVTEQVVLTAHLVQPVFYALRKETWDALSADQKKVVQAAADAATAQNNEARLADEKQVAERLKTQGLTRHGGRHEAVPRQCRQGLRGVGPRQGLEQGPDAAGRSAPNDARRGARGAAGIAADARRSRSSRRRGGRIGRGLRRDVPSVPRRRFRPLRAGPTARLVGRTDHGHLPVGGVPDRGLGHHRARAGHVRRRLRPGRRARPPRHPGGRRAC